MPFPAEAENKQTIPRPPGIYVEILIRGDLEKVWTHTQIPELHQLWDLRFSGIQYLPRSSETEPQRFLYSTRIGFGLKICGEGESTGQREDVSGMRTSALKFWSADSKSLIEKGSGYWQYIPTRDGTRFLTWYDYETRFGAFGRTIDRLLFRPLLGWATAWSFDRLRLWIDQAISPTMSYRLVAIHALARIAIAFIWAWQGVVPKLLFHSVDERAMLAAAHLSPGVLNAIGWIEVGLAALALYAWRWRAFFLWNTLAMVAALVTVAVSSPSYVVAAFNPVTLNVAVIVLSLIGYIAAAQLPSASRCLRQPAKEIT
jgi:hypothetical protein